MKKIIAYFFILICFGTNVFPQEYSFKLFAAKEGYEAPELSAVFQDSRGYLWVGGINGITRSDGNTLVNYNKTDGLIDNNVLGINEDKNHNLWISTRAGISSYDGKKFTNYKLLNSTNLTGIYDFFNVFETSKDEIYAYGFDGLYSLNKTQKTFTKLDKFNNNIRGIVEDKNKKLWLATKNGLYTLQNNSVSKIEIDTLKTKISLTCIAIDKTGVLWLGSTQGILKYNGKSFERYFNSNSAQSIIRDVLVDADNNILFATEASEIKMYKAGIFKTITVKNIFAQTRIYRITQDRNKNYWMASGAGLIKMYTTPFKKYQWSDSINAPVTSIALNKQKQLFFATMQGLVLLDSNKKLNKFMPNNKPDEFFLTSLLETDSCIMVGTYSGKVFKFANSKFVFFDSIHYNIVNTAYQIVPGKKNELWICKSYNVVNYKNGKFTLYDISNSTGGFTQSALTDSKGIVWFAHANSFTKYENGKFIHLGEKEGLNYQGAATLCEDKNHNIWIGTYGNGIVKHNRKTFENFTTKNGLINNFVCSALYDSTTNILWFGTINGVSKVCLDSNSEIKSIVNFNNEHGLESVECNQNSIFKLPNGNILFGTSNGLYEYNQLFSEKNKTSPLFNFSSLRLNYEITNWSLFSDSSNSWSGMPINLSLPYNKNHLTFDFYGINLDHNSNLKFRWMLDGFDSYWNPESKNRSATYSNLPAGKYIFKLSACNINGAWSKPISYAFTIYPPFWKTWWFILLVILFAALCIWVFIKLKINQLKKEETKKTSDYKRIAELELKAMRAQMNPHFMFNTLNSIQDVILKNDIEKSQIYLADLSQLMRLILENSAHKRILLSDEIEFIKLYINLEQLRFGNKFEVKITIANNIDIYAIQIPPMLLQPYIENAIIHGLMHKKNNGSLEINVSLSNNDTVLECCIIDNGVGRAKSKQIAEWKSKKHKSMGIEITNERIQLLNSIEPLKGFDVTIFDMENEQKEAIGTYVKILIPINV